MKAERARQAQELYRKVDETIISGEAVSLIYQALIAAENEALELAAAAGAGQTLRSIDDGTARGEAAANVAEAIRSLKHKDI